MWFLGIPVIQGRKLELAENNYDHFLPYAKDAYLTGHQLAIEKAREASQYPQDPELRKKLLHEAFSMEAFACHFLTDSFASGHIRTPRVEMGKATTLGKDGHLLCKYMHDEDNKYGLRVTNLRGDKWITYGDGMLLKEKSKDNLNVAAEAVQKSVDQVYEAYTNPSGSLDPSEVTDLLPFVDQEERNNSPMFQMIDGKLLRRSDLNDLQGTTTTASWWGPTTVAMLQEDFLRKQRFRGAYDTLARAPKDNYRRNLTSCWLSLGKKESWIQKQRTKSLVVSGSSAFPLYREGS
ncbi:unnamed protein product [Porites lobata]|uniref:Phospholipase C/D domain-containing protein n=1 Tax=Porites lobata TaxID=104759 RepID=A0ABN8QNI6_9CNID|nr:unnamed protein product [Porites lobata]